MNAFLSAMWGHQRQMESSQHSCFCIWWLGWFPLQRFCRSPMDFRGLCKAVLVSQTPGAGNQGLSISPYDTRNAILRCPLFLLPKLSSVSLGFECSLFRAGQTKHSLMQTHGQMKTVQEPCGLKKTSGHPSGPVWVGWSAQRCPLLKSSSDLALLSALQLEQPSVITLAVPRSRQTK